MPSRRDMLRLGVGAMALAAAPSAFAADNRRVVMVRYGGGVRRREVLDPAHSFSPWLLHRLQGRGMLFRNMEMAFGAASQTSHAQGTVYLLTGRYDPLEDVSQAFLSDRFEPPAPTLFEVVRKAAGLPAHEALVINNENRLQDEFLGYSTDPDHGFPVRAGVLSRARWRVWHARRRLAEGLDVDDEATAKKVLKDLEAHDYRGTGLVSQGAPFDSFWDRWRAFFGDEGRGQPRGDRMLTELALRALEELSPRMLLVNYSDCDYVHWGDPQYYTRAIGIMDEGVHRIVQAVQRLPAYAGNTLVVVVPDCGRDDNPFVAVPYQHHFGDRSSHEIFALFLGPGVQPGVVRDEVVQQIDVAPTIAAWLGVGLPSAEGAVLDLGA